MRGGVAFVIYVVRVVNLHLSSHSTARHSMEDLFVGVCFADLNVVAQESKRTNEAMLQALASCTLK